MTYPRRNGFTLIEIVLVLAIAGLIMLVVFFALFGAQRERRDLQRKRDVTEFTAQMINYAGSHNGIIPQSQAELTTVRTEYYNNRIDPQSQTPYSVVFRNISDPHSDVPPVGVMYYQQGHWCNRGPSSNPASPTDPIAGNDSDVSRAAVWTVLETGGIACADNL